MLDIDFHLMLLVHDQFHKPRNLYSLVFIENLTKEIVHIHEDMVRQVDQLVAKNE
jgi:hypothetical protein